MMSYTTAYENFDRTAPFEFLSSRGTAGRDADAGVNAAFICCDRWCGADAPALYAAAADGSRACYTFEELRRLSSQMAHVLVQHGVQPGDRVGGLLPRIPMLLVTILATWRVGAVYQPLFTAFGPKALEYRLAAANTKVVVTDPANRAKLSDIDVSARIFVTEPCAAANSDDVDVVAGMADQLHHFAPLPRGLDDPLLLMFTSGTTGLPKHLVVPIKAIAAFVGYMRDAVGLQPGDRFWNIADPGWAYGLYYAITGPLAMGHATLLYDGMFDAEALVRIVCEHGINNLAGSPTAFRLLISAGPEVVAPLAGQLRVVSSAGEALNSQVARWFSAHLQVPIYDHYGQTELGMVVCNHHALEHATVPGSAGFAVPGHRVVVLDEMDNEVGPHVTGVLGIDVPASPLFWFDGYENAEAPQRYYRSGDIVEQNEDGSISFVGRSDDVITSSGYRIGPFDVESGLAEHPAVTEAAVIGKPDPQRTEIVKAFVVLRSGTTPSAELAKALQDHVKRRVSAHAFPREVEFVEQLPKTLSGKVQRFLLRAQERARMECAQAEDAAQA